MGLTYWLVDVAVGPAASEQIILPNLALSGINFNSNAQVLNSAMPYLPLPIAAGNRIAVRAQCSTATSPDRKIGATFYGVRT